MKYAITGRLFSTGEKVNWIKEFEHVVFLVEFLGKFDQIDKIELLNTKRISSKPNIYKIA